MDYLEKFLDFIYENLSDDRISISKEVKFGHRIYTINLVLRYPEDNKRIHDFKTLQIKIDCRNNCIVVGNWDDPLLFENEELTKKWANLIEEYYSSKCLPDIKNQIDNFFKEVNQSDLDFSRRWKMKDLFEGDSEK